MRISHEYERANVFSICVVSTRNCTCRRYCFCLILWLGSLCSLCLNSFRWGGCRRWWLWGPGELVPPESCDLVSCRRRVQYFSFTYWTIKMAISAACINVDIVQLSFPGWYGRQRSLRHKGGLSSIAILRASFLSQRWVETSSSFLTNSIYIDTCECYWQSLAEVLLNVSDVCLEVETGFIRCLPL